eukprot:10249492-Prorocentrum_lima.AAC.1
MHLPHGHATVEEFQKVLDEVDDMLREQRYNCRLHYLGIGTDANLQLGVVVNGDEAVSYTHLRAHETRRHL